MSLLVTELIVLVLYKNGQGPLYDYDLQVFMAPGTGVLWIVEAKRCLKCKESDACLWIIFIIRCIKSYAEHVVPFVLYCLEILNKCHIFKCKCNIISFLIGILEFRVY